MVDGNRHNGPVRKFFDHSNLPGQGVQRVSGKSVVFEPRGGVLHFNPSLPEQLDRLRMRIRYRRQILDVEVEREVLRITSRRFTAAPITVAYRGQFREMSPGDSYSFRLIHPPRAGAACAPRRTLTEAPT